MAEAGIICAQIVLTVFNVIQFLFGWLLIIVGAVAKVNSKDDAPNVTSPVGAAIFLIVIGCILVVVSIIGCLGTWSKNFCLLVTFCVFTAIIFVLVIIALIIAFVSRSKIDEALNASLNEMIKWNDTNALETMQDQFKCCGVHNYTDWKLNEKYKDKDYLPISCCEHGTNSDTCKYGDSRIYMQGCWQAISNVVKNYFLIIGGIAAACAIVMFIAIFAAAYMAHTIRGSYHAV